MGIKMAAEYKNTLIIEEQEAKRYKSEHKYSLSDFDLDSLNSENL